MVQFIRQLFCPHKYFLANDFEMKSEFEIVDGTGYGPTSWQSTRRLHVTDYVCTKCNKVKRLKAKTPRH